MKLINPTNDELNAAFATHVVGLRRYDYHGDCGFDVYERDHIEWIADGLVAYRDHELPWLTSADAVLLYLEYHQWTAHSCGLSGSTKGYPDAIVKIIRGDTIYQAFAQGPHAFARAATIALLRANGVEVVLDARPAS